MAGDSAIVDKITALLEPLVAGLHCELVEVQFRREPIGWVLRLIIDSENGIGVDECARVSREAGFLLDVEDLVDQPYHLEVSSPGLDRPLKTERDFARNKGQKVRVILNDTSETVVGVIDKVKEGQVVLATQDEHVVVSLDRIVKAKLVIEF